MTQWKLYQNTRSDAPPPHLMAEPLRHDPSIVVVQFDFDERPLPVVAEAASDASLRPLLVTTKGFLLLISWALDEGLVLRDLQFTHTLPQEDADEVTRVVLQLRNGGSLEPLRSLLNNLLMKLGVIVDKATFWMRPTALASRVRYEVYSNGIVFSTGGKDALSAMDLPLSALGQRALGGASL